MQEKLVSLVVALAVLCVVFRAIEWFCRKDRRLPLMRRGFRTDLAYWFFTPTIGEVVKRAVLLISVVPISLIVWGTVDEHLIMKGFGPASRLPTAIQVILMLIIGDFVGYWTHRFFHRGRAWRFHAVHHSSVDLDWLASVRMHPLNEAVMAVAAMTPILALGFSPAAFLVVAPFVTLMAILVHSNVDWDWGPFRCVLVSPRFHRWHHTDEAAARDKNFAGLLPLWDILFGTYYMPVDSVPSRFGTTTPVPQSLLGQLKFPFDKG